MKWHSVDTKIKITLNLSLFFFILLSIGNRIRKLYTSANMYVYMFNSHSEWIHLYSVIRMPNVCLAELQRIKATSLPALSQLESQSKLLRIWNIRQIINCNCSSISLNSLWLLNSNKRRVELDYFCCDQLHLCGNLTLFRNSGKFMFPNKPVYISFNTKRLF